MARSPSDVGSRGLLAALAFVAVLAALPALSLIGHPDAFLADARGELPVKLWVHETFAREGIFGATLDVVSWPNPGPLNNPDPVGTVVTDLARPFLGRSGAYNLLVELQILAAMLAAFTLALDLIGDALAAVTAAVVFGLAPLLLTYCVGGAVTDVLNIWPYPLIFRHGLRALRGSAPGNRYDAVLTGIFGGIGVVTCPYNMVVFVAGCLPAAVWLPLRWRAADPLVRTAASSGRAWIPVAVLIVVTACLVSGAYVVQMRNLTVADTSQMSQATVGATRHVWPYPYLVPGKVDHYYNALVDYLLVGKEQLVFRDVGARFTRAVAPGWCVLALVVAGVRLRRRRRVGLSLWLAIAVFAAVASTGPFLPLTEQLAASFPCNPAWLIPQWFVPAGNLLLEPFRYALVVSFGLAIPAAFGTAQLMERVGRWVGVVAPLFIVTELALVSPVPFPLPVAEPYAVKGFPKLSETVPPGALVMLPYYERGTARLRRIHFWQQLLHGRPIADQVAGFPPDYLIQNALTAVLIGLEGSAAHRAVGIDGAISAPSASDVIAAATRLAGDGFAALVLEAEGYANLRTVETVQEVLAPLGPAMPVSGVHVYLLPGGAGGK